MLIRARSILQHNVSVPACVKSYAWRDPADSYNTCYRKDNGTVSLRYGELQACAVLHSFGG